MTKMQGFAGVNLVAEWQIDYRKQSSQELLSILPNLESLSVETDTFFNEWMGIKKINVPILQNERL